MYRQLDIFSYMKAQETGDMVPVLLTEGQKVYLVKKGDIREMKVERSSWICEPDNRGYSLTGANNIHAVTWNDCIGTKAFTEYGLAQKRAQDYLKEHKDVILAKDIIPIQTTAFFYIRKIDNRKMTAFYCDLGNDTYYIKEFMTYHHICKGKKAVKEINHFMNQQEFLYDEVNEIRDYIPSFKTMYKTISPSDWDYAEGEYSYAVG